MMFPMQPIKDRRFVENRIVRLLLDSGFIDMNDIDCRDFTREERTQFAQLIGYSLSGFAELDYVDDETYATASRLCEEKRSELEVRNEVLRGTLDAVEVSISHAASILYQVRFGTSDDVLRCKP